MRLSEQIEARRESSHLYEDERGFRRPYSIHYYRPDTDRYVFHRCDERTPLDRALKLAQEVEQPQVTDGTGRHVATGLDEVDAVRDACLAYSRGGMQAQIYIALKEIERQDPELGRDLRMALPSAPLDLTDPEAGAVLACMEEEGLL